MQLASSKDFKGKTALLSAQREVTLGDGSKQRQSFGAIFDLPVMGGKEGKETLFNVQGFLGAEGEKSITVFGNYNPNPGKAKGSENALPALKLFTQTGDGDQVEFVAAFERKGKKPWFSGLQTGKKSTNISFFTKGAESEAPSE